MSRIAARGITGRQVLIMVVGFFAIVSAVNAVMIWLALGSFPGVVSRDAYREGLAYNRTLEARRAQDALGWRATVDLAGPRAARELVAIFNDRDGAPLAGLEVAAELKRPVAAGNDRTLVLRPAGPGTYRAELGTPMPGHWSLSVTARRAGDGASWTMERTLWLD